MALSGLQIYKLLPQTNCKECGFPTCLAFAMKLAQKGTELDKCPYVSEEAKTALDAASAPPIKLVTVGVGDRAFGVGNESAIGVGVGPFSQLSARASTCASRATPQTSPRWRAASAPTASSASA